MQTVNAGWEAKGRLEAVTSTALKAGILFVGFRDRAGRLLDDSVGNG